MRTSPGPGSGSGSSPTLSTSSGSPCRSYHAAFNGPGILDAQETAVKTLVVNYVDKLLARAEQHNRDDYRTCLSIIDGIPRNRVGGLDPLMLGPEQFEQLYGEMATDNVDGWDKGRYDSPARFLLLLRRHAMTGAFAHPKSGGNSGTAGWMYLESRFRDDQDDTLFDWRRAIDAPLGHNTDYRG